MSTPIYLVDAFCAGPFTGNPAAVCLPGDGVSDQWMQSLAAEMNQAETAFVTPAGDAYNLRWFTPVAEMDLCGHATLASAHVLWETGRLQPHSIARFNTLSGMLTAERAGDEIALDFPELQAEPTEAPPDLLSAIGAKAIAVGANKLDLIVEVATADEVRKLQPDMALLATIPIRGVIVTAPSDIAGVDFVSRFFGPGSGIPEDPATGSSHCCLAPYWAKQLGKTTMVARQLSPRGGYITVECQGHRVRLVGRARTVLEGSLAG